MENRKKYDQIFMDSFQLESSQLNADLIYQSVPAWDSIGHMTMVAAIEDAFGIMLEMDDIIDYSSYLKGIEMLKKYNVSMGDQAPIGAFPTEKK